MEKDVVQKQEVKLKYHLICCLVIFVLTFAVYFNSLKNEFVHDDILTIVENNFIKDIKNIKYIFTQEYFASSRELTYRPICTLTYFIEYYLYKLNPTGYHLTNILFHILNSILIYFLALIIFKNLSISQSPNLLSLFTSLLYSLHPIATEPVNAISFREDLLAMCFFLISFLFYIKYFNLQNNRQLSLRGTKSRSNPYLILSLTAFIISLFSKESAVVLPAILILYDFSFSNTREVIKRKYYYAIYFIILAIYIYLTHYSIFFNPYYISKPVQDTGGGYFTFLTMLKVFASYIKLLLLPFNLRPDYIVPISHSLFEPLVLTSITVLMLCFVAGIIMYRHNKIIFFAIFYFFICLAPVSNIIRIVLLIAERFIYLPYLGFCIIISIIFLYFSKFITLKFSYSLFVILISFYSFLTFSQNKIWKNGLILWETTAKRSPNSASVYNNLGIVYDERGNLHKAEYYYKKAIGLDKNFAQPYNNLGVIYDNKGDLERARKYYKKAIGLKKGYAKAYNNLGIIYDKKGNLDRAEECFRKAIELDKNFSEAYNNLGFVYDKEGNLDRAEECFRKAIELDKNFAKAYNNLGVVYGKEGNLDRAEECFRKAIELNKNYVDAYNNLGVVYGKRGNLAKAEEYFRRANELNKIFQKGIDKNINCVKYER